MEEKERKGVRHRSSPHMGREDQGDDTTRPSIDEESPATVDGVERPTWRAPVVCCVGRIVAHQRDDLVTFLDSTDPDAWDRLVAPVFDGVL